MKTITKLFALLFLFNSCDNDNAVMQPPSVTIETLAEQNARIEALISSTTITGDLIVTTVDEFGNYLPDVNITIDGSTYSSGTISNAIIEDVTMNENYVFVTAEKNGYEKVMKTITPSKNGLTNVELMLITDVASKTLNAATGGIVTDNGITLNFPTNAIVDASGIPYTGSVDVNMVYYDPTDTNFAQTQPGTLVGVTETDEIKALVSEGMLTVDLTDGSGNKLNIADNNTVKITMPASASGPATIPFWHLNETHGIWVEQGEATKVGNTYEYEVTHFSTYNLDWFENPIANGFCVKLKDQNGNILANQNVELQLGNGSTQYVTTDNLGEVCFENASMGNYTFKIDIGCGTLTSTSNITTSGTHDIVLDLSPIPNITNYSFTGTLSTCNNQLAINKPFFIEIDDSGVKHYLSGVSDQNGMYTIYQTLCLTSGIYSATLYIIENNGQLVNNFNIEMSNSNIDLSACNFIVGLNGSTPINIGSGNNFCFLVEYAVFNIGYSPIPAPCTQFVIDDVRFLTTLSVQDYYLDPITWDPILGYSTGHLTIQDITGIKYFYDLQTLDLSGEFALSDISELAFLPNITSINLNGNSITDISALAPLTTLTSIDLSGNIITDISALAALINLTSLELSYNNITDISDLYSLINLTDLDLRLNPIPQSDVDALRLALPSTTILF